VIAALLLALAVVADFPVDALGTAAADRMRAWREPPYGACRFVQDQFGATPDNFQEELLVAVMDPTKPRISLQACAGPGKTCGLGWVCGWFLGTQVYWDVSGWEYPNGLATSVTRDNLTDNLWKECAKWIDRSPYLSASFRVAGTRIFHKDHPRTWFMGGRTWPKSGTADEQGRTFSGLHGKSILVLVDESGSIPPTILRAAEQALPNTRFGKLIQAGNPISHEGCLYEAANIRRHLWYIIQVTGDPDVATAWVHNPRVANVEEGQQSPADWAREQIATYGRDNPWVQAYILGQFPPQSINSLLSLEDVLAAQKRDPQPSVYQHLQKRIGVDVARFGDDRTVLWPRQGAKSWLPVVMRGADTNEIVGRVLQGAERFGSELTLVDNSFAWGNGVVDNLRHVNHRVHPVNFAGKAIKPHLYENRRAEGWLEMAKAIKELGHSLPPGLNELHAELTTPTFLFANGVFKLEPKEIIKKRLGRSPDLADALALTYMLPEMPSRYEATGGLYPDVPGTHGRARTDYDPLERA
jgi:phage terminase large subunit